MSIRLLLSALVLCFVCRGQDNGAAVTIDGKEVVRVYGPLGTFTAKDRASAIQERIVALADKGFAGTIETRSIPSENATAVVAGPAILMAVTDMDAQTIGAPREVVAQRYAKAIQNAVEEYRARRSWKSFVLGVGKAVMAWVLFCVTVWALWKAIGWLGRRSEAWFTRQAVEHGARGVHLVFWQRSRAIVLALIRVSVGLFLLSEFSFLISFTFGLFPWTAGVSTTLLDYLEAVFGGIGMAIIRYLPSGGFVVIVCVMVRYILKLLKFLATAVERGELPIKGMHPEMARPTYQLLRFIVIVFALVVAFPYLPGGQSDAFKGVSIFLGLLLSLGSSSAVSNVLAGLVLTYMRPFRGGDRVKIADTIGDVVEKSLLVTRLRTIKNVEVVIPNAAILGTQILNYSAEARTKGLILHTTVTIGYDAPWRTVHDLLIRAGLNTPGVLANPAPFVLETSLNDFHISYELNAYTDQANAMQEIYSRLHQSIQDSFNEGGVEIMSPTFYAVRDGNTVTIPADHRPADYEVPSFRVKDTTPRAAAVSHRDADGAHA